MTAVASGEVQTLRPVSDIALVDLLDRLLGTGVVLAGDIVISLAGVDLVEVRLQALITSVRAQVERDQRAWEEDRW
jgi:hypothetical protein